MSETDGEPFKTDQGRPPQGERLDLYSDEELQLAVDRTAFAWGEILEQNNEALLRLTQERGLDAKEARTVFARLKSGRRPPIIDASKQDK